MQVASEQIVTAAAAPSAPAVQALPLREEGPDLAAIVSACRPGWMRDALCREYPKINFLGASKAAKRVCSRCSVQVQCRDYGLDNAEIIDGPDCTSGGIWGGLSAEDRRRLRGEIPVAAEVVDRRSFNVRCTEVCRLLSVSPAAVRALAENGELPWRLDSKGGRLYSRPAVEALAASRPR